MTLPELLALVQKAPVVAAELVAVGSAVSVFVGAVGTGLEHIGELTGSAALEKFGQRLEALGTDLPKFWRGSRFSKYIDTKARAFGE